MSISLTIAISTFGNGLISAKKVIQSIGDHNSSVGILIVHQIPENFSISSDCLKVQQYILQDSNIDYLQSSSKGLTKSRNIAINHCQTSFIWFMDDDVEILPESCHKVLQLLGQNINIACHRFECLISNMKAKKNYPEDKVILDFKEMLRVGSIELVANNDFLKKYGIYFQEDMGVGADTDIIMGKKLYGSLSYIAKEGKQCIMQ